MCKFKQVICNTEFGIIYPLHGKSEFQKCYETYLKYFRDDFYIRDGNSFEKEISSLTPFLWLITDYSDRFAGFVFLDNFVGNGNIIYSAELTTCFDKRFWGIFPRYCAKFFLKKCFDEIGLQKIKAQIYPDNFRVKRLLKSCGFEYESTLKNETIRFGKPQDIEVYGLYATCRNKTGGNNDNKKR